MNITSTQHLNLTCDTVHSKLNVTTPGEERVLRVLMDEIKRALRRRARDGESSYYYLMPNTYRNFQFNGTYIPLYNGTRVAPILAKRLQEQGFVVSVIPPRQVYIDWKQPTTTHGLAATLNHVQHERRARRQKVYDILVSQCKREILKSVRLARATGTQDKRKVVWWTIPKSLMGQPLYNMDDALSYIMDMLKRDGFSVCRHLTYRRTVGVSGW